MRSRIHLPSALLGALLLAGSAAALRSASAQKEAAGAFEYKVVLDPSAKELAELAREGWEYSGYLGESEKGERVDETLWRRPAK